MGLGIFLGLVGVFTAIFVGVKVSLRIKENKYSKKEQSKNIQEQKADAKKYAKEPGLFDKEISRPYEDKTTRSYENSYKNNNKKNNERGQ